MTEPRIITSVTATVPPEREEEFLAGYRELTTTGERPDGLLRSELLKASDGRWLIQTLWRNRGAVVAARVAGSPPAALVLLDGVGAEHTHDLLSVEDGFEV